MVEKPVYHATEKVSESFLEILVLENESIHTDLVSRRSSSKYPPSRSSFKSSTSPVAIAWSTESITLYRGDARCVTIMKKIRLQQPHRTFSKATSCPCGFKSPPHWGVLAENCQLNGVAEDGYNTVTWCIPNRQLKAYLAAAFDGKILLMSPKL